MLVLDILYVVHNHLVVRAGIMTLVIRLLASTGIRATVGNHRPQDERDRGGGLVLLKAKIASSEDVLFWKTRRRGC